MKKVKKRQSKEIEISGAYGNLLESIKEDIKQTQLKAAQSINVDLILLYWRIGKTISEKITKEGWGAKTVDKIACDLGTAFPGISGFSARNLRYMRKFAEIYHKPNFAAVAAKLPWGHNMVILDMLQNIDQQLWYIQKAIESGWSRNVLLMWIESDLYGRQGKAITNFSKTLPKNQSDLAEQVLKDPYCLDFLMLKDDTREKEIEKKLMQHLQSFLVELGQGFAFVGRQYHLVIGKKDYYIDLLFYHLKLRAFVVVELKAGEFDPRDAGQLSFYLTAVDEILRSADDKPTIGLLLCKSKEKLIVEYALRKINGPIGVAGYMTKLVESLPKEFKDSLPSIEVIKAELSDHSNKKRTKRSYSRILSQAA